MGLKQKQKQPRLEGMCLCVCEVAGHTWKAWPDKGYGFYFKFLGEAYEGFKSC